MLVLFETCSGYALFKVVDEAKLKSIPAGTLHTHFQTPADALNLYVCVCVCAYV